MFPLEESPDGVSESTLIALTNHLPHSIALFRRLQFMNMNGGKTRNSHVFTLFKSPDIFTVAYLDFSRGTETEMWLYSSMERLPGSEIETNCQEQVLEILKRVKAIENPYVEANGTRATPGIVLIGSLHEKILRFLEDQQRVKQATGPHFKFIFKAADLPPEVALRSEDLIYSEIRKSDIPLVLSRTEIPRKEYDFMFSVLVNTWLTGRQEDHGPVTEYGCYGKQRADRLGLLRFESDSEYNDNILKIHRTGCIFN